MKSIVAWIVFFILVVAGPVAAEDTAETQKAFSGTGEAGVLMTTGNSETESVNARLGLKYETGYLLAEAAAAALYRSEETDVGGQTVDKTSAEKYTCSAKLGYKFNAANYVFVHAAFEDDRFSGYDYQSTYTAGYGRGWRDRRRRDFSRICRVWLQFFRRRVVSAGGHRGYRVRQHQHPRGVGPEVPDCGRPFNEGLLHGGPRFRCAAGDR